MKRFTVVFRRKRDKRTHKREVSPSVMEGTRKTRFVLIPNQINKQKKAFEQQEVLYLFLQHSFVFSVLRSVDVKGGVLKQRTPLRVTPSEIPTGVST